MKPLPLVLLVLAAAVALPAQEPEPVPEVTADQEETPRFPSEIDQVIVDMVVTDGDGNPVSGITREDLIVEEAGVPQEINSFDAVDLPDEPVAEPPAPARVTTNARVEELDRGRTFVVIFDDMNLTPQRALDAKGAVASFLENGVREGDYVNLVATSGTTWWTARMPSGRDQLVDTLKRLEGRRVVDYTPERIGDWEAMRISAYNDPIVARQVLRRFEQFGVNRPKPEGGAQDPFIGTVADPYVNARATEVYQQAKVRNQQALGVIERALNGLAAVRGRKSVILVSEGFIQDPNMKEFRRVTDAALRANAAIYFLNASGLEGLPAEFTAQFGFPTPSQDVAYVFASANRSDDGSEAVADQSGGFSVQNTNDLSSGIDRIARESLHYYLLGYVPSNSTRDGAYREIEVRFKPGKGKGLKIRARQGYYAPTESGVVEGTREGVDPQMQAALDSPWPSDGIPLRMTHYAGAGPMSTQASVLIVTEVDIDDFQFTPEGDRQVGVIEFLLVVAHRESGEFFRYEQSITMRLRPSTRERLSQAWFPIMRDFELQAGDHQAKIIVREPATGRLGSVTHEFVVPPLDEFWVATPVLTDTFEAGERGLPELQPIARREFKPGQALLCEFEVFGAQKGDTGLPRVEQGYRVIGPDGSEFTSYPESEIQPTSLGSVSRTFGFSLEGAKPGDYTLLLTFHDRLADRTVELREPFTVVSPDEAATEPARVGARVTPASPDP